jgi:hypothetical protein
MSLSFPYTGEYYCNPCVSISYNGIAETIQVGPLKNSGAATAEAYVQLWSGPAGTSITQKTAQAIPLNPGPDVVPGPTPSNPLNNMLIRKSVAPGGSQKWSCSPQISLSGNFDLFAQAISDGIPASWQDTNPMNALDNVRVADVERSIFAPEAALARGGSPKASSKGQDKDLFYAFGIQHDDPDQTKTRLVVETFTVVETTPNLRKLGKPGLDEVPVIQRVLRSRSPKAPAQLTCFLGRERIVSLPHPFGGHPRLQHTGVIAAETHKRLCATNAPQTKHSIDIDIERGELRQGILALQKEEATDLCLIHVRLELQSDGKTLGGFVLVA